MTRTHYRDTKCATCKYFETCYGITDEEVREKCTSYRKAGQKEPAPWQEMSYHKYPAYGTLTMQERMRREFRED